MTLILFIALIAVATFFKLIKWRRFSHSLYAIGGILFVAIGVGIIPKYLLTNLQSPAEPAQIAWSKNNIIVLLGAGTEKIAGSGDVEAGLYAYGRLAKTAALYGACKRAGGQCKVIVSGGDPQRHGAAEADAYAPYLQQLGVDKTDLILEKQSRNTWENAQFSAPLITALLKQEDAAPSNNILLVTSGFHMRRSLLYFNRFGIRAQPVRADYASTAAAWFPLAYNFLANDIALHEYVGMWRYRLYNLMGWNATAGKQ